MTSNAKRGEQWESICSHSFDALDWCTVVKVGAPVKVVRFPDAKPGRRNRGEFTGFFERRGTCDFEGGYRGRPVSIEAKRTKSPRFAFSAIADHQQGRMEDTVRMGGLAGVLLTFDAMDTSAAYFGVPWVDIDGWIASGSKSITPRSLMSLVDDPTNGVHLLRAGVVTINRRAALCCYIRDYMDYMLKCSTGNNYRDGE